MKKILALAALFCFVTAAAYFTSCKGKTKDTAANENNSADSMKAVVERGKYLVENVAGCIDCHSKRDFTKFSGPVVPGSEFGGGFVFDQKFNLPGVLYGRNISPDNETGIGTWTDEEILRAITQGINKKGDTLFPLMPYPNYNRMAKSDLLSIIAYLRTVKPVKNAVPARQLMIPIASAYPGPMLQPSVDSNRMPDPTDKVAYGGYLTTFADCATCHSPMTEHGPDVMNRPFAGGYSFQLPTNVVVSANITPDSATGIGTWNEERFMNKFLPYREEKNYNYDPGKQNTIMPLSILAGMKDEDLKAIYAYLRTVKPIKNQVEKFPK